MRKIRPTAAALGALALAWAVAPAAAAQEALSAPDEPSKPAAKPAEKRIDLGLGARFLFVDVDGPGGFSNRDPDPIRPETRDPYFKIDRVTFEATGHLTSWLAARARLRATDSRAHIDRGYLRAQSDAEELRAELGLNRPVVWQENRTHTYSLLETAFFRNTEYHLSGEVSVKRSWLVPRLALSIAEHRPLVDDFQSQDDALGMIAFGDAKIGESNPLDVGGVASLSAFGATVAGYGFSGELSDNEDSLYLDRIFQNYELAGDPTSRDSRYYGVRAQFDRFGLFVKGEKVWARQGLLQRNGFEFVASYTIGLLGGEIEPIVRRSELIITNFPEEYAIPQTWDRSEWLFGALIRPIPMVEIKVERVLLGERAGVSREGKTEVDNDEWIGLVDLEISDEDFE